ncbi:hypothetical protein DDZ16_05830 [Marinilabilia rubra]|uniref:Uncharacterized protein n=1 Tax=Marinilabilia rubra TaxID=2162893 RepID=A0A2U2BBL3_9BACT|nr:hypothetical protein DDZ16_05830 [Marinilabilia rubra]
MQAYFTIYSNFFALDYMKLANQKNKIYFTASISKYFNTLSIGRLVNSALLTFSAAPNIDKGIVKNPYCFTLLNCKYKDAMAQSIFC